MFKKLLYISLLCFLLDMSPAYARAGDLMWPLSWMIGHEYEDDYERPYLDDGVNTHMHAHILKDWSPESWIHDLGGPEAFVQHFRDAGYIKAQYINVHKRKTMKVGEPFKALSAQERTKLLKAIDHIYGIVQEDGKGALFVRDAITHKFIGVYSRYGFQSH